MGRELAGRIKSIQNRPTLAISTVIRISLLILLMLTNCQPRHNMNVYFTADWIYIGKISKAFLSFHATFSVLIALLGLTNGLNASVAFICGCSTVQPRSAPRAAAFLTICLTFGLTLGACSSFLVILAV